jgi:SAM-dependent methyltransferase
MNSDHSDAFEARRRREPSFADTDYLVLKGLSESVRKAMAVVVRRGERILDFGCGSMPFRSEFEAEGCAYAGADFGPNADVSISDDGRLPARLSPFDGVVSFQVLEHVRDLDVYFAEARRALTPGGWMILSTHGSWLYHPHPGDYRRWTRDGLIHDIQSRGFKVERIAPVLGPLAWTTVLRLTGFAWALRKIPMLGGVLAKALAVVMNLRAMIEDRLTPHALRAANACVYVAVCRKAPLADRNDA